MKTLTALMLACACSCALGSAHANAQGGSTMSQASELSAGGSALVILGSMSLVAASATVVVASVEVVGESTIIVLKGASDAATATVKLSGEVARGMSIVAGTGVSVVAMASGYALIVAGEMLAFVPTELGRALLHHSPAGAYRY